MRLLISPEHEAILIAELIQRPPERLVHLVGVDLVPGVVRVTDLVIDDHSETSGSHCRPSAHAEEQIQDIERATGSRYLGIVHSHPNGVPDPSGQDAAAAHDTLEKNLHLPHVVVGVATRQRPRHLPDHRVPLGRGQLSLHTADRDRPDGLTVARASIDTGQSAFVRALRLRMPADHVDALLRQRIAIVGVGSVGSTMAEMLVRSGIGAVHLVDSDTVDAVNLSRSAYATPDLGRPKVDALADRLAQINPLARVTVSRESLSDDTVEDVSEIVAWADLVIAATDDPRAQAMLDHLLQTHDTPGLFAGVYAGGHMGEMVIVIPGITTCYRCAAGERRLRATERPATDYATGRLRGAVALGSDVATISTIAAKTALDLLGLINGTDESLMAALSGGTSMVQIGLAPHVFDGYGVFDDTPNQHALQTVWLWPEPALDCDHCARIAWPQRAPTASDEVTPERSALTERIRKWFDAIVTRLRRNPRRMSAQRETIGI